MKIPTYEEARRSVDEGEFTPLDSFIVENEPAGHADEVLFRKGLQALVDYLTGETEEQEAT